VTAGSPLAQIHEALAARGKLGVAAAIAREHDVDLDAVLGRERRAGAGAARRQLWYELKVDHRMSSVEIARLVRRDDSTVSEGILIHARAIADARAGAP